MSARAQRGLAGAEFARKRDRIAGSELQSETLSQPAKRCFVRLSHVPVVRHLLLPDIAIVLMPLSGTVP